MAARGWTKTSGWPDPLCLLWEIFWTQLEPVQRKRLLGNVYIYIYIYERLSKRFMSEKHQAAGTQRVRNGHSVYIYMYIYVYIDDPR